MGTGEILVNQMYAGEYLAMGNIIGHEAINLLKADDGKRYLYVTPNGKVQGHCVESILFVRKVRRGKTVEVVAAATGLSKAPSSDKGSMTYNGVRLADIYGDNMAADTSFRIDRESKNNIDIRIEDSRHIVVIENKAKSGVNGIGGKYDSQLKKYQVKTDEEAEKSGKESHYFVFAPDVTSLNLHRYDPEGVWAPVSYSDICDFFKDARRYSSLTEVKYFDEFVRGLERLVLSDAERNFRIMQSRFLRRVNEAKGLNHQEMQYK